MSDWLDFFINDNRQTRIVVNFHNIVQVRCFRFSVKNWQKVVQNEYVKQAFTCYIEVVELHDFRGHIAIFISWVEDGLGGLNANPDTLHHNHEDKEHMHLSLHKFELGELRDKLWIQTDKASKFKYPEDIQ